jgi:predicted Rossmann fold flavoprotein
MNNPKILVVIGGGAAGFFCAVNAARIHKGLKVILIEKSNKLLSKVKVSGGGRCNTTHACFNISELITYYPRGTSFLKKAFHHFSTSDTVSWFEERGVVLKTESDGRMFPVTDSSQTIIDCLLSEAQKYQVEIIMNADARQVSFDSKEKSATDKKFVVTLANGKEIHSDYLCISSGGLMKAAQFQWLEKSGHTIVPPVPSLFTFNVPGNAITDLMGITVSNVTVKLIGTKLQQEGNLLITHWGMSGPAILKLSSYGALELATKNYDFHFSVNWLSHFNENTLREKMQLLRFDIASQKIINRNPFGLPSRLWEFLLKISGVNEELRWADLPAKEQNKLIKNLCSQEFHAKGKTTFKEEFVTAGGIELTEIDSNSMQSKLVPGLFFAGEIINVDGVTGGFNFQNAWTTGWIAAQHVFAS